MSDNRTYPIIEPIEYPSEDREWKSVKLIADEESGPVKIRCLYGMVNVMSSRAITCKAYDDCHINVPKEYRSCTDCLYHENADRRANLGLQPKKITAKLIPGIPPIDSYHK